MVLSLKIFSFLFLRLFFHGLSSTGFEVCFSSLIVVNWSCTQHHRRSILRKRFSMKPTFLGFKINIFVCLHITYISLCVNILLEPYGIWSSVTSCKYVGVDVQQKKVVAVSEKESLKCRCGKWKVRKRFFGLSCHSSFNVFWEN